MTTLGRSLSQETKEKISRSLKEYFKHNNHSNQGKNLSEKTRRKISLAHKGKILSESHREI